MIRPITCICFLLACGSGLYLYQAKHRVQVLDRQIEETVQSTDKLREQARVLHAEWTLLNDPQRLQALADQFLPLKTVQPGQFTSMADLASRLPPVPPPEATLPAPAAPSSVPVAEATPSPPPPERSPATVEATAPTPPQAKPVAIAAAATPPPKPPEHKPVAPRPMVAEARPAPRVMRPILAADIARPALPHAAPFAGSALGMARTAPPLPQPVPLGITQWGGGGNGGG